MYEIGKHTVHAEYADKTGNPFWDALPQMLGAQELFDRIRSYPTLPDNWQSLPAPERRMLVQRIHTIFHPFAYAYDLYDAVNRAIRSSYMTFHTIDGIRKVNAAVVEASETYHSMAQATQADCGAILGVSGIGKTSALKRCFSTMPQVIEHEQYGEYAFFCKQVLYLFVECPADCTIKSLGRNIAYALDSALGTSYAQTIWMYESQSVGQVAMAIKQLCLTYHIGVIVLDEVQNLINNSNIGRQTTRLVKFLVELMNDTATSIYLIGTMEAENLFMRQDHLKRRTRGARLLPMQYDKTYQDFLNSIWRFQMTKEFALLNEHISELIYYAAGGVTSYIIKIFMEAQIRAIATGAECLSENIIISTIRTLAIERPVSYTEGVSISSFVTDAVTSVPPTNYIAKIDTDNGVPLPKAPKGGRKPRPRSKQDLLCLLKGADTVAECEEILRQNNLLEVMV